jgi:hypothetical protein
VLVTPSGCSNDSGGSEQGPNVSPVLETDRQSSATIGMEGGSIEATGSDGTQYTLTIPAEALITDTEITITPILDIPDLPMSGGLVGGAHFEPSGLELFRTATLRVALPSALDLGSDALLAGFTYDGDGKNLALGIAEAEADALTLPILHFSGGGSGSATPLDLEGTFAAGTADAFSAEVLESFDKGDFTTLDSSVRRWYEQLVKPALQAAVSSDQALERALREYRRWFLVAVVSGYVDVSDLVSDSQPLAAAALSDAIARANDLCKRQESFAEAEKALTWLLRAERALPESVLAANQLDRDTVRADLCLQVVFESTSFPQAPVISQAATLSGVVGYAFGGGATQFAAGMDARIGATGASPANSLVMTNASGEFEQTLTPMDPGVTIEIKACIGNAAGSGPATGSLICQDAFIVRGLVVSPASVTLAPAASQQFTAQLLGIDEPVTWSADGGTVDANGLYVAGSSAGAFTVTATSIADPNLVDTARVTVEGDPVDPVTTAYLGTGACFDIDFQSDPSPSGIAVIQTGNQLEIYFPRVVPDSADLPYSTDCIGNDSVYQATISGGSFSGSTNDCTRGPCTISGTLSGDTISGRAFWQGDCECYTDFEATITDNCVVLGLGSPSPRLACQP